MSTKPRLKLHLNGSLTVLQPAELGWTDAQARKYIRAHYGSTLRCAKRWHLNYGALALATMPSSPPNASRVAGLRRTMRQIFGLRVTQPSVGGVKLAEHAARLRAAREARS